MSTLQIDGKDIFYDYQEGKSPCVLLSHGYGMSADAWEDTAKKISDAGYAVLTYDHRCCGRSDKSFSDVSISAQGSDIVALCDHLEIDQVVLNGWSLGGAIVVDAASKLGDRLVGLVLTGGATPRYTQADGFPYGGTAADVKGTVEAIRADRETFLRGLYFEGVFVADVGDAVKEKCLAIALQADEKSDDSLGDLANLEQRSIMKNLNCPALIVHGVADQVVPVDIGRVASELLVNSKMLEIEGCGHAPFLEFAEQYNAALLTFLGEQVT